MAKAEFLAPHTFAFAGGVVVAAGVLFAVTKGMPGLAEPGEALIGVVGGALWALMLAAFYSLGCAWAGAARPRNTTWAFACGIVVAVGFLAYTWSSHPYPPPTTLAEARQEYTRGTIGVAYTFLAPVFAGLICGWISRRSR